MKTISLFVVTAVILSVALVGRADELAEEHGRLKEMLEETQNAINNKSFDAVLDHLHPNGYVVFQNGKVYQGRQELKEFIERAFIDSDSILKGHHMEAEEDKPAWIYDDMAVAYGTSIDTFNFRGGETVEVNSKWTTTLKKEDGEWKIHSLQLTANMFDNPILNAARNNLAKAIAGGLIAGMAITLFIGFLVRVVRSRKAA